MDVTPPTLLRRLGIALAGLAVAALTGAACVLSFDDLRALAITGEAGQDLAYLYPAAFDALLAVALISMLLLRSARPLVRVQTAIVLALLIVAAAAVNVATTLRFAFDVRLTSIGVAVAPWVMLALALWLWLLLIKHVQAGREARGDAEDDAQRHDIVPFHRQETPVHRQEALSPRQEGPSNGSDGAQRVPAAAPALMTEPEPASAAAPTQPLRAPVQQPRPEPAVPEPRSEAAPEPVPQFAVTPAPEPAETTQIAARVTEWPAPDTADHQAIQDQAAQDQAAQDPAVHDPAVQDHDPEPEPEPVRPVRWGDRVRPSDVLVHPREPRLRDTGVPDPLHGPEQAEEGEYPRHPAADEDTAPHPVVADETPAPSVRLRSTPRRPEPEPEPED